MTDIGQVAVVWVGVLLALLAIYRAGGDVRPIFINVVRGVAKNAQSNATAYGIAIMFGLSASLSAFYDAFAAMESKDLSAMSWHQYAALWTHVLNPFIVAVLAYATQNNFQSGPLAPSVPAAPADAPAVVVTEERMKL